MIQMEITTRAFRKNVKGWLTEEDATVEEATKLLSALHAGAIAGDTYAGHRFGADNEIALVNPVRSEWGIVGTAESENKSCGCLIDTLERIQGYRPRRRFEEGSVTNKSFSLALMIGIGDTPDNSVWAKAAAKGVEDYLSTK